MVGFCHLTDSHHYNHGQKPTMVGICHGGNMLGNHDEDHDFKTFDDDCDESLNANTLMTAELRAFEPLVWF